MIKSVPGQFVMHTRTVMDLTLEEQFSGAILAEVEDKYAMPSSFHQYKSMNRLSVLPSSYSITTSMPTWEVSLNFSKSSEPICADRV